MVAFVREHVLEMQMRNEAIGKFAGNGFDRSGTSGVLADALHGNMNFKKISLHFAFWDQQDGFFRIEKN